MEMESNPSGESGSDTASIASPTSKAESFVVSYPLTRSEIEWLKLQSKLVAEASDRFFAREEIGPDEAP